jgi:hypothetical protein
MFQLMEAGEWGGEDRCHCTELSLNRHATAYLHMRVELVSTGYTAQGND